MDKKEIKTVSIEHFKEKKDLLDYCENDVIVMKNKNIPHDIPEQFKLDCFILIFCYQGKMTININSKEYILNQSNCAVLLPNSIVHPIHSKKQAYEESNTLASLIGFSSTFLKNVAQFKKETWNIIFQLYQNPILPVNKLSSYKFYLYKEMAKTLISEKPHPYREEILKHFFASIFCEMIAEISKILPQQERIFPTGRRSDWIFRKFIDLVLNDDGTHRSVAYYADKLCYSPKHLSCIIKEVSGRPPLKIINEHAMNKIKHQLKHSDMSMKELADYFDFANPSFFGKFVKQNLGMSPQQYRHSKEEE